MEVKCQVCGERASGFHFGAFSCKGCKSFFGRTCDALTSPSTFIVCRNGNRCIINGKTRRWCKACRLRKCRKVGMSKSGSRHGRRSNWFKMQYVFLQHRAEPSEEERDCSVNDSVQPSDTCTDCESNEVSTESNLTVSSNRPPGIEDPSSQEEEMHPLDLSGTSQQLRCHIRVKILDRIRYREYSTPASGRPLDLSYRK